MSPPRLPAAVGFDRDGLLFDTEAIGRAAVMVGGRNDSAAT